MSEAELVKVASEGDYGATESILDEGANPDVMDEVCMSVLRVDEGVVVCE